MYTGNKITIRTLLPAFVAQITIMIVSLAISLRRIMTSPHCVETDFPITIIAYRYASPSISPLISSDCSTILV